MIEDRRSGRRETLQQGGYCPIGRLRRHVSCGEQTRGFQPSDDVSSSTAILPNVWTGPKVADLRGVVGRNGEKSIEGAGWLRMD